MANRLVLILVLCLMFLIGRSHADEDSFTIVDKKDAQICQVVHKKILYNVPCGEFFLYLNKKGYTNPDFLEIKKGDLTWLARKKAVKVGLVREKVSNNAISKKRTAPI